MATSRPVNDQRTLAELAQRLLAKLRTSIPPGEMLSKPGATLQLEISHFAPPEQLTLPGLDGRPTKTQPGTGYSELRLNRLHRQEDILANRFGTTPFRHLAAVDFDSVLSERIFSWGDGMGW